MTSPSDHREWLSRATEGYDGLWGRGGGDADLDGVGGKDLETADGGKTHSRVRSRHYPQLALLLTSDAGAFGSREGIRAGPVGGRSGADPEPSIAERTDLELADLLIVLRDCLTAAEEEHEALKALDCHTYRLGCNFSPPITRDGFIRC